MIDMTSICPIFPFLNGFLWYNQIKISQKDEKLKIFRTPLKVYFCSIIFFGLKNTGATYQWAIKKIFNKLIHHEVKCFIKDLLAKSIEREDHLYDPRMVIDQLRWYFLKMNSLKCTFGITLGIFLWFLLCHHEIELDLDKIKAIIYMPSLKNLNQFITLKPCGIHEEFYTQYIKKVQTLLSISLKICQV